MSVCRVTQADVDAAQTLVDLSQQPLSQFLANYYYYHVASPLFAAAPFQYAYYNCNNNYQEAPMSFPNIWSVPLPQ